MNPRSVAVQGVGFGPLAMASQGFLGSLAVVLGSISAAVVLGGLSITTGPVVVAVGAMLATAALGPLGGEATMRQVTLEAIRSATALGRHGFGVPAPLGYLWIKLSRGVTRGVTKIVTQWRSG